MPGAGEAFAAHHAQAGFSQEPTVDMPHTAHVTVDFKQPTSQQGVHATSSRQTSGSSSDADEFQYQQMQDWVETTNHSEYGPDIHTQTLLSNSQGYV